MLGNAQLQCGDSRALTQAASCDIALSQAVNADIALTEDPKAAIALSQGSEADTVVHDVS